jgi:cytochrome c551/c552
MKLALIAIAAGIGVALFQTAAYAEVDAEWAKAAAKEQGCLTCHAIDKKKVGPAWQDVGAGYKGKKAGDLAASIKSKPVHAGVLKKTSDKDLGLMAEWILSLSK